jgi:hypothetical protein
MKQGGKTIQLFSFMFHILIIENGSGTDIARNENKNRNMKMNKYIRELDHGIFLLTCYELASLKYVTPQARHTTTA